MAALLVMTLLIIFFLDGKGWDEDESLD